tara:strand:- start:35 stop:1129 length:1095 start_codon:yes stop_codon:yes gene_type:complete
MKGFAGGGAFVVPFDTPATRKNPNLTSQRWGEAMRGGYSMPGFSDGGKFNPKNYSKDSFQASRVVLNDKSYYVTYGYEGTPSDAKISIKSMSKRTKAANLFGQGEQRVGIDPSSEEFKAVMNSGGLKTDIAGRHKSKGNSRGRGAKPSNITEIKIHPKAQLAYRYNKSYQENYAAWKKQGVSDKQAKQYAARAAMELAEVSKDGSAVTTAEQRGEENLIVNDEGKTADQLTPPPDDGEDKSSDDKEMSIDERIKKLFGAEGALQKGLKEFGKYARTESTNDSGEQVNEAEQKKTESKLDSLKAMTAQRDAAMQPFVQESQAAPIMAGGGEEIIIPSTEKNDADEYLLGKFGIVAEARSTLVNFM